MFYRSQKKKVCYKTGHNINNIKTGLFMSCNSAVKKTIKSCIFIIIFKFKVGINEQIEKNYHLSNDLHRNLIDFLTFAHKRYFGVNIMQYSRKL